MTMLNVRFLEILPFNLPPGLEPMLSWCGLALKGFARTGWRLD
jgi:hypothetical protein